ncbi:MAG: hypothetical protein A4E63_02946 [Syntrophorhabdus sp. PtaU1.Bin050]|nr:MAG: hypothetical protein A4E63_02946 [Syntrophorhabdus sp. PtaU1.Bin050]
MDSAITATTIPGITAAIMDTATMDIALIDITAMATMDIALMVTTATATMALVPMANPGEEDIALVAAQGTEDRGRRMSGLTRKSFAQILIF